jgi:hypothetical protein
LAKKDLCKTNEAFVSYTEYFDAVRQASLAAHNAATIAMESKLIFSISEPKKTAAEKQANKSEKIEFAINEETIKFYEESYKFKKEKSILTY